MSALWPTTWIAQGDHAHPLVGKIWSTREARFVPPEALAQALRAASVRLLGEVHDNPDHHRLQAWMVRASIPGATANSGAAGASKRTPVVVFEQLGWDQQPALKAFMMRPAASRTVDAWFDAMQWEQRGWPPRKLYSPLIEAGLDLGLEFVAGDAPRGAIRSVARGGLKALPDADRQRIGGLRALPAAANEALLSDLVASHCGLMPKTAMGGMADAQLVRDAHLARVLADAVQRTGGAILIAGHGHVRNDRAVPWHLAEFAPEVGLTTVVLAEVEAGQDLPQSYGPHDAAGAPAADFIVWTPRPERADPCAEMRKSFGRKKT